jgi:hypothetical protein
MTGEKGAGDALPIVIIRVIAVHAAKVAQRQLGISIKRAFIFASEDKMA